MYIIQRKKHFDKKIVSFNLFKGVAGSALNELYYGYCITRDSSNAIYISDFDNHRVLKYTSGSTTGTVAAGGNGAGYSTNQLYYPAGVAYFSPTNSLYIVNYYGNNVVSWVLGASSWTLLAGTTGTSGSTPYLLSYPFALVVDSQGNFFVSDSQNYRVQFFLAGTTNGSTIAGTTGVPGNSATEINIAYGLAVDNNRNLYVSDTGNMRILKFSNY